MYCEETKQNVSFFVLPIRGDDTQKYSWGLMMNEISQYRMFLKTDM